MSLINIKNSQSSFDWLVKKLTKAYSLPTDFFFWLDLPTDVKLEKQQKGKYSNFGQVYPIANKFEKNGYSKLT